MKDQYSLLAPFYNRLTKLVFGEDLTLAKRHFVENIEGRKVLIIGGGDGLAYQSFQNHLSGEYWEISRAMLQKAEVNLEESGLSFHLGFFQAEKEFDEVWLHFVLDTMLDEEIESLLREIRKSLKPQGTIHLADFFSPQNFFQRIKQGSMIGFFRIAANHKRKNLPDYEAILENQNWVKMAEKDFLEGWVKAQKWSLK
ncbi:Methyltransferase domain-containing protein [Algoriphagus locisalis]|uniref:Methyltransferase domain-containing protein n=1 Tax=Algoriphagus locisalis TaxID=305507 RepID=A0A1I7CVG7_9BACT|nr:class I SAM-dependent methyltransferase [Algoriphagus locisalis]SFU03455.1 Methyltransferase domain-containing protein [Algoriphagus locisalis]